MPYLRQPTTFTAGTVYTSNWGNWINQKVQESISVLDYGAVGDGITDDTNSIQTALNTTAKFIIFPSGYTYLYDGGLTSSVPDRVILAYGAKLKLKNSATNKYGLSITGTRTYIEGGEWDGNKANDNAPVDTYTSYAVGLFADKCTAKNMYVHDFHGIGLKGFANYLNYSFNEISGTTHYGIYLDGSAGVTNIGNKAIGNNIDMSSGGTIGQGILFTAGSGGAQVNYLIQDNDIIGPSGASVADQAINLAVRGNDGCVYGNTTRYGSMGWSEGGANCIIANNNFLQLRGTTRVGIEPSGKFVASNNIVTDAYVGIDCTSSGVSYDGSSIDGGYLTAVSGGSLSAGIRLQAIGGTTARRISISGVNIIANLHGILLAGTVTGITINGGTITGPGIGSGRGIFLDTVDAAGHVYIKGCTFTDWLIPWSAYSAGALTYTDLHVESVATINCGSTSVTWPVEGSAVIGDRCSVLSADSGNLYVYDVANNIFEWRSGSFSTPESNVTGGVGSIYIATASGNVYRKGSGTGNTGWVAM